jgi:stage II sporulation protein R
LKRVLVIVFCAAVITGIFAACAGGSIPASSSVKQNVIRLHILANSDSDADQSLKLKVRDLVLKDFGSTLASEGSADKAWKELNSLLPDIKKDIAAFLSDQNASYGVELETGVYDFPVRDYNGIEFPEGRYQALRIELGAAAGHNWWCVMFPPLCLIGDGGNMDMDQYKELVKELQDAGVTPDTAPDAPVHSWIYDQLFGSKQWDSNFYQWAKDNWLGGENK